MVFKRLGLAYRANKVVLGTDNIIAGMKNHKVKLVVVSTTASLNTQKVIQDKASFYNTNVIFVDEFDNTISKAIGKKNIKVIGIKDQGFKKLIIGA